MEADIPDRYLADMDVKASARNAWGRIMLDRWRRRHHYMLNCTACEDIDAQGGIRSRLRRRADEPGYPLPIERAPEQGDIGCLKSIEMMSES
ncbi:hypothetical protein NDN01_17605 [Sphingomonas sp. QA11]|uniref:hypothetical protein n=1 Tax=Sphingomonas sp. QA11 TaxID=2950605 RepID=UPI00234BD358|nr:hypothetical protein [Sphingomonas sp. QA11]WCM25834.1 hypothetical protein NDN01_17605 [Sphingomonas sp. QA11]